MKKLIIFLLIFFIFLPPKTTAQSEWTIGEFHSDIIIQSNGKVRISETIPVNFYSLEKHGIYRDIPITYQNPDGSLHYSRITVQEVKRDGIKENYSVEQNEASMRIKIGNADRLLNGNHSYFLSYTAEGIIIPYSNYDELYWNVTGNKWEAPIEKASVKIVLPKSRFLQSACYQGVAGSTRRCTTEQNDVQTVIATSDSLLPAEGMTIAVGFEKGIIPILAVEKPKTLFERLIEPGNIVIFLSVVLSGTLLIIKKWWSQGRDFWTGNRLADKNDTSGPVKPIGGHETIVVEFTPPDKLLPAELGLLVDEKADTLDVTATIIDLARRGYLHIEEVKKTWILGKTDYIFTKKAKPQSELVAYEKLLLDKLFTGKESVALSSLKQTFSDELQEVKKSLYVEIVAKKLFIGNPDTIRQKYLIVGGIIAGVPVAIAYFAGFALASPPLIAIGSGFTIVGLILIIFSRSMPRRSAYGRDLYRRTLGYRLFFTNAEQYRQKFYEKNNLFDELLPYAIVFGLTEKFAKALNDMGIKPMQPSWYSGSRTFNPVFFASSMNAFSQTLSQTMAAAPKSSGSGGGGFSGGGFGGGGGGSW